MKKHISALAAAVALGLAGCAGSGSSWTTLVDNGSGMENFDQFREANWASKDGAIQADRGGKDPAYLVSKQSYKDFELRAEFWASDDANSGVFLRCQNRADIGDESCFEANIFDQRPDPSYATGAIVKVAAVPKDFERAGGKWNTFEITAQGAHLVVVMNGKKTVDVMTTRPHFNGPIALQWGRGTIKFRKVQIREL
jgi:Domain of Unknown Function (DUF1080)